MSKDRFKIEAGEVLSWGQFDGFGNSVEIGLTPLYIVPGKPFIYVYKRELLDYGSSAEVYYSSYTGADSFSMQQNSIAFNSTTKIYYSDFSKVEFENVLFQTAGCEEGLCRIEIINLNGLQFSISIYNHETDVIVGSTLIVNIGTLPTNIIQIGSSSTNFFNIKVVEFTMNLETWKFDQFTGNMLYGSLGNNLIIFGNTENFWQSSGLVFLPKTRFIVKPYNDETKVLIHISPISFVKDAVVTQQYSRYKIKVNDITLAEWKEIFDPISQTKIIYTPLFDSDPMTKFEAFVKVCEHRYINDLYYTDQVYLEIVRDQYKN